MKPRLLDLFCCAGGAAMGYHRAGFDVTGIDLVKHKRYPFAFKKADALEILKSDYWREFDAIHASPPCQDYSAAVAHLSAPQPRLIEPVRNLLEQTGLPWVIENVIGSPLPEQSTLDDRHGIFLCGTMFGLRVRRHRLFETSFSVAAPLSGCEHSGTQLNPYNSKSRERDGITKDSMRKFGLAMGIDWMVGNEIGEAIPPAMTEFLGLQILAALST